MIFFDSIGKCRREAGITKVLMIIPMYCIKSNLSDCGHCNINYDVTRISEEYQFFG